MSNVIKLDDPFSYLINDKTGTIEGVQWFKGNQYVHIELSGKMSTLLKTNSNIGAHELRQLMIMWLALVYPDTLKFDDLEKENLIREETE
jgi:hypothetical protein